MELLGDRIISIKLPSAFTPLFHASLGISGRTLIPKMGLKDVMKISLFNQEKSRL